jgi:hypothetical protein
MIPLARRLAEITVDGERPRDIAILPVKREIPDEPGILARKLEDAFEQGRQAGEAAARQDFAARLNDERERFVRDLRAQRQAWSLEQGERLSQQLAQGLCELENRLAECLARILEPFVKEALRRRAVDEFCALAASVLREQADAVFAMKAPRDLLEAIAQNLGPLAAKIDTAVSDRCEIEALSGLSAVETRLSYWLNSLEDRMR